MLILASHRLRKRIISGEDRDGYDASAAHGFDLDEGSDLPYFAAADETGIAFCNAASNQRPLRFT